MSVDAFAGIFHHDYELRYEMNERIAALLYSSLLEDFNAYSIGRSIDSGIVDLTEKKFDELYDPELPTIGIDARMSFMGNELVGLAAHEDETRVNIVYVQPSTDGVAIGVDEVTGNARVKARSGILMSPSGQIHFGDFPQTVIIDKFETADEKLLEQCKQLGVPTFLSVDTMNSYDDKSIVETLTEQSDVATPRRLARSAFFALDDTDDLAIKPRIGSQGRGVLLTDFRSDPKYTKRYYEFLERCEYEPVVEERIRSFEIIDPETDKRLDWNVRAILTYGELAGMYVRADYWGGPVNLSKTAKAISIEDFPKYFMYNFDAQDVIRELHRAARAVALENPTSFVAADFTVDEDREAYLFELNHGHAGGIQTIARMQDDYDGVMRIPRHVLGNFIEHTEKTDLGQYWATREIPMDPSFTSQVLSTLHSSRSEDIARLDPLDIPWSRRESIGASLALASIRQSGFSGLTRDERDVVNARLGMLYPIEVAHFMKYLGTWEQRAKLLPYIDLHEDMVPENSDTLRTRVVHAARDFDREEYFKHFWKLKSHMDNIDSMIIHQSSASNFVRNFAGFIDDAETLSKLCNAMSLFLYAQERADVTIADDMLNMYILHEEDEEFKRALHALKFWMLYGDGEYEAAMEYVDVLEAVFPDRQELYHNVVYTMLPYSLEDFRTYDFDKTQFLTELVMRADDPLSGVVDITISPWSPDFSSRDIREIADTIASSMPLDGNRRERKELRDMIYRLKTAGERYVRPWKDDDNTERLTDFRVMTRLIEAVANYNRPLIRKYIDELRLRDEFGSSLDIIEAAFI